MWHQCAQFKYPKFPLPKLKILSALNFAYTQFQKDNLYLIIIESYPLMNLMSLR